jgi:phage shock protein E
LIARSLLAVAAAGLLAACSAGAPTDADAGSTQDEAGVLLIEPKALALRLDAGDAIQLIDVRTPEEFADGHIEGAINIPVDQFDPTTLPDPQGAERILYCQSDRRSGIAAEKLAANGDTAVHMKGGIRAWEGNHLPVTRD